MRKSILLVLILCATISQQLYGQDTDKTYYYKGDNTYVCAAYNDLTINKTQKNVIDLTIIFTDGNIVKEGYALRLSNDDTSTFVSGRKSLITISNTHSNLTIEGLGIHTQCAKSEYMKEAAPLDSIITTMQNDSKQDALKYNYYGGYEYNNSNKQISRLLKSDSIPHSSISIQQTATTCKDCNGSGKCSYKINDKQRCQSGDIRCIICEGTGKVQNWWTSRIHKCVSCGGIGHITCTNCNGTTKCKTCKGEGKQQ